MRYKRILLKLSGESLAGAKGYGLDGQMLSHYVHEIQQARGQQLQIAIVVGGGNIFRGVEGVAGGLDRARSDQMGMLATVINAMALGQALEQRGVPVRLFTATPMPPITEHYSLDAARRALDEGAVLLLAGGTGNPFFTTDSAAALRAAELRCDALLKGTRVDGIYTADPEVDPSARRYEQITFTEALERQLRIMDQTAFTLCQENGIPIVVFDVHREGNLARLIAGEAIGTIVTQ